MKNKEVDLLNWELELYEYLCLNLMGCIAQEHNSGQRFGKLYNKIKLPIHNYGLL